MSSSTSTTGSEVAVREPNGSHLAVHEPDGSRLVVRERLDRSVTASSVRSPVRVIADDREAVSAAVEYAATIAGGAIARDRAGAVPRGELAAFDRSGLLGITVPREYGGVEVSPRTLADVIRTIAAVDPAIAQVPQGHYLFVDVLRAYAPPRVQRRLFVEVLDGGRLGNALAERGGHHAQDLATRLGPGTGSQLSLTGRKYYCTGAITSRWIAVTAVDSEDERLKAVFVPRDAPGIAIDEDWDTMGQRATVSGTATFDRVAVDPGLVIDYQNVFEGPQQLGARAQLVHAAIEVGIASGALADAREFLRTGARPSSEAVRAGAQRATEDPHTMLRYGRLATQVRAAESLLTAAADILEQVGLRPATAAEAARGSLAVAQAKAFASEVAVLVASDLFAMTGTSATDARHDLDRHWRNARTHSVHDPVDWKYHHLAAFELDGTLPPNHGQL